MPKTIDDMDPHDGMTTPTPRPIPPKFLSPQEPPKKQVLQEDSGNKAHSGGNQTQQQSTPVASFANGTTMEKGTGSPKKEEERVSPAQASSTGEDVAVADSDNEREVSENDTDNNDAGPPSKKKKGQRFFCTEFPPCTLSFTRSEHLARHIRYVFFKRTDWISVTNPAFQKTHGRTPFSMSLSKAFLSTR